MKIRNTAIACFSLILLAACQVPDGSSTAPAPDSVHSLRFSYWESGDIGPVPLHGVDVLTDTILIGQRSGLSAGLVSPKSSRLRPEDRQRLIAFVEGIPSGYWGRKIPYEPLSNGAIIYRMSTPRFYIEIRYRDGSVRSIETDGLDSRLHAAFTEVLSLLPKAERFVLPGIEYIVDEDDLDSPFTWRLRDSIGGS